MENSINMNEILGQDQISLGRSWSESSDLDWNSSFLKWLMVEKETYTKWLRFPRCMFFTLSHKHLKMQGPKYAQLFVCFLFQAMLYEQLKCYGKTFNMFLFLEGILTPYIMFLLFTKIRNFPYPFAPCLFAKKSSNNMTIHDAEEWLGVGKVPRTLPHVTKI